MSGYRDYIPTLRFGSTLALSPDGTTIAYVDDGSGQFNLVVQDLSGGGLRTLTDFDDSSVTLVAWHPRSPRLAFEAHSKGAEITSIYEVASDGGPLETVAEQSGVRHHLGEGPFSPDGRFVAYSGNDRTPEDEDVLVRDMATGGVRRVFTGGGAVAVGSWSPDGTRLSLVQLRSGGSDHVVHVAVPGEGSVARLMPAGEEAAPYWLGPWLPDGSGLLVRTSVGREFTGIAIMDAVTGDLTWVDTPDWDVEGAALAADGRTLVWSVNVDGASQLRGRDLSTGEALAMPALPAGMVPDLRLGPDGRTLLMRLYTATDPMCIAALDLASGQLRRVVEARPAAADPASLIEATAVHIPAGGGRHIPGNLYRPARDGRVGVLVSAHGGPAYQERPLYSMYDGFYQYLLRHGIAVLAPNVRGSAGYGRTYRQAVYRDWGGPDLGDFAAVATYLREQEWVDPDRVGVFGASYGGFVVLSCLSRLPEFNWAAGVDLFGPSNLVTFARSQPPMWREMVRTVVGDPDQDEDFLLSRSPVTYADQIQAPLFVIQGANDPRVPQAESDQIVERLRTRGVEVRYDVYPDAGHGFDRREDQITAYSDIGAFLVAHLGER